MLGAGRDRASWNVTRRGMAITFCEHVDLWRRRQSGDAFGGHLNVRGRFTTDEHDLSATEIALTHLDAESLDEIVGVAQAGRVDESERPMLSVDDCFNRVTCRPGHRRDERTGFA